MQEIKTQKEIGRLIRNLFDLPKSLKDKNIKIVTSSKAHQKDQAVYGLKGIIDLLLKNSDSINTPCLFVEDERGNKDRPHPNASIVSSVHGKIKKVLMTYPKYKKGCPIYAEILLDLLQNLDDVDFHIFTFVDPKIDTKPHHPAYERMYYDLRLVLQATKSRKGKVHFILPHDRDPHKRNRSIGFWAQDPFIALKEDLHQFYLVEPVHFLRNVEHLLANHIENADKVLKIKQTQVKLYFEGGNILVGDDFILIGKDYIEFTRLHLNIKCPDLEKEKYMCQHPAPHSSDSKFDEIAALFQFVFGCKKEIIVVGYDNDSEDIQEVGESKSLGKDKHIDNVHHYYLYHAGIHQPLAHLDVFITLVGRNNPSDPYLILIAEPCNISGYDHPILEEEYFNPLRANLDKIATFFTKLKYKGSTKPRFKVKRIPMPLSYIEENNGAHRCWRHVSYNNCIVENSTTQKNVYFPTYGSPVEIDDKKGKFKNQDLLKKFDSQVDKLWQDIGFKTHPLINYLPLMMLGGAVHCVVKFLSREND